MFFTFRIRYRDKVKVYACLHNKTKTGILNDSTVTPYLKYDLIWDKVMIKHQ